VGIGDNAKPDVWPPKRVRHTRFPFNVAGIPAPLSPFAAGWLAPLERFAVPPDFSIHQQNLVSRKRLGVWCGRSLTLGLRLPSTPTYTWTHAPGLDTTGATCATCATLQSIVLLDRPGQDEGHLLR
jgi:hypothetical protein